MKLQDVLERFALISGLTLEETEPWAAVCNEAVEEIRSKLKSDVVEADNDRRLNAAAAALSFYRYTLYKSSDLGIGNFSVGDISVNSENKFSMQNATFVWNEARSMVADLLEDDLFFFERVR